MPVVLKYLLQLRFVLVAAAALAAVVVEQRFAIDLPWAMVSSVLAAMTAYSLWSWRHWRDGRPVPDVEFIRQNLADLLALSVLVYYTGGPVNPFISLFLLPIVFAAATLSLAPTIAIAASAVGAYTLLMFFYVPVVPSHAMHGAQLHLWGMWYGFLISASGVAFFVSRIARSLRRRDQALAAARERRGAAGGQWPGRSCRGVRPHAAGRLARESRRCRGRSEARPRGRLASHRGGAHLAAGAA